MNIEDARRIVDERIVKRLSENPKGAKDIGKTIAIEITGEWGGRWVVDCAKDPAAVIESADSKAHATITLDSKAFEKMISGDLSPHMAFMAGQIKVDGDLGAAVKFGQFLM